MLKQKIIKPFITLLLSASSTLFAETLVLTANQLLDIRNCDLISPPVIVIENDRIVAVGKQGELDLPTNAKTIHLPDTTLLPGLMDMHLHITGRSEIHGYRQLGISNARATVDGVRNAQITLMAGITTARNLGSEGYSDVAIRDAINDGTIPGPRLFVSGPALGITGGHCDNNLLPSDYGIIAQGVADGPWGVRQKVRENFKYDVDLIKFCATGGVLSKGTKVGVQQYTLEEMQTIVDEAHRRGKKVAAHAHGTDGIKAAIKAGVDSIEHASFLDREAINMAKKKGTTLSMDIYVTEFILSEGAAAGILQESLDKERETGTRQRASFTAAVKAGVNMVMGTDASIYPHGDNPKQLSRMVRFGMTPLQALQAATINSAKLLGQETNIGAIEVGKYADIIGIRGNPLEDISQLEQVGFVMKGGVIYKRDRI